MANLALGGSQRWLQLVVNRCPNVIDEAIAKAINLEPDETVQPEAIGGNGNGHHHATGIRPKVELVLGNGHHANGNGNGHAAVPVNGNGYYYDETPEPQQSLFTWVEFMAEEPVKPEGPQPGSPQPASTSLFDWALTLEQEREAELVGAGR